MSSVLPDVRTARGLAKCVPSPLDPSVLRLEYSRSQSIKQVLVAIFLPTGYPASVSPDYMRYYTWQFVQGLCSTITGMLSSKATLEGLGVGAAGAAAATATLFLALKDAVGRIASIGFAWWQGSQLDCNAKRWRLIADVANDVGVLLELVAPLTAYFVAWWAFVFLISLANVARAVAGVAGGATRVSMVQHFALKDNIADLSAKAGSQELTVAIAGGLIGMILGMVVTALVDGHDTWAWITVLLFTALHIYANWLSLKLVVLKTINKQRGHLLFSTFFNSNSILTPRDVSAREGVWTQVWSDAHVQIGVTPDLATRSTTDLVRMLAQYADEKYALTRGNNGKVTILLKEDATAHDQIRALFQAEYMHHVAAMTPGLTNERLVADSLAYTKSAFPALAARLGEAGWNLTTPHLSAGEARIVDKTKVK